MADFKVDPPPVSGSIADRNGNPTPFFRNFMRDLWRRTSDPRGNAIETAAQLAAQAKLVGDNALEGATIADNKAESAQSTANSVGETASEAAELAGTAGETAVLAADAIVEHRELETAHGSNGAIAGINDLPGDADTTTAGLVKQAANIADAANTTATISGTVASVGGSYNQTEVQAIVDQVNALTTQLDQLITDYDTLAGKYNSLLAEMQTAGQMA